MRKYWNQLSPKDQQDVQTQFAGWSIEELRGNRFNKFQGVWHIHKATERKTQGINTLSAAFQKIEKKS
jgi:hypothetical protein